MILEIKKLMARAAYTGEFSFDYQPPQESILIPLCRIQGGVKVTGDYEIFENDEVEVTLKISYLLVGSCSYCLADAQKPVEYSTDVLFVTDKDDCDNYVYDGNRLDLSTAVNDALLFSQPKVLLCKEDCKGVKFN
ncbi:MAG: YceD family protein [Clostridia bacterium]|nr:YceD family protein [Clostridia bacterium]